MARTPRLDVLASNMALAGLRSGTLSITLAIEWQQAAINSPEGGTDKFIHRVNLAGYLLLDGQDRASNELIADLRAELETQGLTEAYLHFYLGVLEVAGLALSGDIAAARSRHDSMTPLVAGLKWPNAAYIRRRHELLPRELRRFPVTAVLLTPASSTGIPDR